MTHLHSKLHSKTERRREQMASLQVKWWEWLAGMVVFLIPLLLLALLSGCKNRNFYGPHEECIGGVVYLRSGSAINRSYTPKLRSDGLPVRCPDAMLGPAEEK